MQSSRRRFVRQSLVAAGALCLPVLPIGAASLARRKRIAVVGAGMAGLAAGRELARRGGEVVILEARDRIGGRVWTDRSLGFPVERGANWIEGSEGNPLTPIARAARVRTLVDASEVAAYDADGRRLGPQEVVELTAAESELEAAVDALAGELETDISVEAAVRSVLRGERLSRFEQRAVDFALAAIETDVAGSLARASLLHGDDADSGFDGDDLLFPDGYDGVVRAVAHGLDLRLRAEVRAIDSRGAAVRLATTGGALDADAAVIAVPLGVLRAGAIRIEPELPADKRDAIRGLEMGTLDKVILRFSRRFWPDDAQLFFYVSKTRGEFPEILDWHTFSGVPALLLFAAADWAVRMESLSDRDVVARAMRVVRACFGSRAPDPEAHLVTRWMQDVHARGSYSFVPLGASAADRTRLAAPVGERLFFCGEATSRDHPATVHGAYLSGLRAAAEVADALGL